MHQNVVRIGRFEAFSRHVRILGEKNSARLFLFHYNLSEYFIYLSTFDLFQGSKVGPGFINIHFFSMNENTKMGKIHWLRKVFSRQTFLFYFSSKENGGNACGNWAALRHREGRLGLAKTTRCSIYIYFC